MERLTYNKWHPFIGSKSGSLEAGVQLQAVLGQALVCGWGELHERGRTWGWGLELSPATLAVGTEAAVPCAAITRCWV